MFFEILLLELIHQSKLSIEPTTIAVLKLKWKICRDEPELASLYGNPKSRKSSASCKRGADETDAKVATAQSFSFGVSEKNNPMP